MRQLFAKNYVNVVIIRHSTRGLHLTDENVPEVLARLTRIVAVFVSVLQMIKLKPIGKTQSLKSLVKNGRLFVEVFNKQWMLYLGEHFREYNRTTVNLLKMVQKGTRQMQTVCSVAKAEKDVGITSLVPQVKKSLESLIYHVKLIMQERGYGAAFKQGNLKHKGIDGKVVASQPSESDSDNDCSSYDDSQSA